MQQKARLLRPTLLLELAFLSDFGHHLAVPRFLPATAPTAATIAALGDRSPRGVVAVPATDRHHHLRRATRGMMSPSIPPSYDQESRAHDLLPPEVYGYYAGAAGAGTALAANPSRKGGGLVDAPGRGLVGAKGENRHCPPYLLTTPVTSTENARVARGSAHSADWLSAGTSVGGIACGCRESPT
jgi:hypothetical protein